jgi:hypothetical protein
LYSGHSSLFRTKQSADNVVDRGLQLAVPVSHAGTHAHADQVPVREEAAIPQARSSTGLAPLQDAPRHSPVSRDPVPRKGNAMTHAASQRIVSAWLSGAVSAHGKANPAGPLFAGATFGSAQDPFVTVEDSLVTVEDSFVTVEDSFVTVEDSFVTVEDSFVTVEDSFVTVEDSLVTVEDSLVTVEDSFVTVEDPFVTVEDAFVTVEDLRLVVS